MSQRILIITNGPPSRNPRPVKEAYTLGRAGYEVHLLYINNDRPSVATDVALLKDAPFTSQNYDLLEESARGRRRALLVRLRSAVARKLNARGASLISALGPAPEYLRLARKCTAELTIVHNEIPHWIGCQLLREGRRVAADIEDWHSEDLLPEARRHRPLRCLRASEAFLLQRAAYCMTTSQALAKALQARYGGKPARILHNSFPLRPLIERGKDGLAPSFFWFSQTVGPGRGLEGFFEAWALSRRASRVVLLGEAKETYRRHLLALVPESRREAVQFIPLVPAAELPGILGRQDIGLALELATIPNRNLTITNKILEYLNGGLAVLASETEGQREVLSREPEAGLIADTTEPRAYAQALDQLLEEPGRLRRRQAAARNLAERCYCWEREQTVLLQAVSEALV